MSKFNNPKNPGSIRGQGFSQSKSTKPSVPEGKVVPPKTITSLTELVKASESEDPNIVAEAERIAQEIDQQVEKAAAIEKSKLEAIAQATKTAEQIAEEIESVNKAKEFEFTKLDLDDMQDEADLLDQYAGVGDQILSKKPGISTIREPQTIALSDKYKITIPPISSDPEEWTTIQTVAYRPNRQQYFLDRFAEDFSNFKKIESFEMLAAIASRSKEVGQWLARIGLEYAAEVQVPLYIKGVVDPTVFKKSQDELSAIGKIAEERSKQTKLLADSYKAGLAEIERKSEQQLKAVGMNPVTRCLNIKSNELPLSLIIAIEGFVPAKVNDPISKKVYAREVLTQFKIAMINFVIENKLNTEAVEKLIAGFASK